MYVVKYTRKLALNGLCFFQYPNNCGIIGLYEFVLYVGVCIVESLFHLTATGCYLLNVAYLANCQHVVEEQWEVANYSCQIK